MRPERARDWLDLVLDRGWTRLFEDVVSGDPLAFPGYAAQLEEARRRTGESESVVVAEGAVAGHPVIAVSFEFGFLGGSMGTAAGERIARAFERATAIGAAVVALVASGGARMQEGMLALAQMPATVAAREALARAHLPFVAYLTHPTTGGVYASFASLADVAWAEPGATIGFAGPRVAEAATGEPLPEGSHTAEFALDHGLLDEVVAPADVRARLVSLLGLRPIDLRLLAAPPAEPQPRSMAAWEQVRVARDPTRPSGGDFLADWTVLRLRRSEDPTLVTTMAELAGRLVVGIGQHRHAADGRTRPSGFRRAREAIALAVRLGVPVVTLIDTPGAHPGVESEAQGLAREIALTFASLLEAPVPTVGCVVGEGGSGGALALAACDRLLIQENAIFSVIAPEGAAAILRRDDLPTVAEDLRLTAADLYRHGLADAVVAEPPRGAQADPKAAADTLAVAVAHALAGLEPDLRTRARRWRTWRGP